LRERPASPRVLLGRGGGVESGGGEALGREEAPQPPAHAAGAADDHRALARPQGRKAEAVFLLDRHRGADEPGDEVFGHFRVEPALSGDTPRALHHRSFLCVVRRREVLPALELSHLPRQLQALCRPRHEL
jgi:hypothetical protein